MSEHKSLEQIQQATRTSELREEQLQKSNYSALHSLVKDLHAKFGVHEDAFQEQFERRKNYYHDRLLRCIEDVSPRRAAGLDGRAQHEVPEDDAYPPPLP